MDSLTFRGAGRWAAVAAVVVFLAALFISGRLLIDVAGQSQRHVCENGVAVFDRENNPGLVEDCKHLLGMKEILEGTGNLNWRSSASITTWQGIVTGGDPTRVQEIHIDNVRYNGTLPARLKNLDGLRKINLAGSSFTGTIPKELGELSNLTRLQLQRNQLTGEIPKELGNLSNLEYLGLSENRLTGEMPSELGNLRNLRSFLVDKNELTGSFPTFFGSMTYLLNGRVQINDNNLTGHFPLENPFSQFAVPLYVTGNNFIGCIPFGPTGWVRIIAQSDISELDLPDCGTLPTTSIWVTETVLDPQVMIPGDSSEVTLRATYTIPTEYTENEDFTFQSLSARVSDGLSLDVSITTTTPQRVGFGPKQTQAPSTAERSITISPTFTCTGSATEVIEGETVLPDPIQVVCEASLGQDIWALSDARLRDYDVFVKANGEASFTSVLNGADSESLQLGGTSEKEWTTTRLTVQATLQPATATPTPTPTAIPTAIPTPEDGGGSSPPPPPPPPPGGGGGGGGGGSPPPPPPPGPTGPVDEGGFPIVGQDGFPATVTPTPTPTPGAATATPTITPTPSATPTPIPGAATPTPTPTPVATETPLPADEEAAEDLSDELDADPARAVRDFENRAKANPQWGESVLFLLAQRNPMKAAVVLQGIQDQSLSVTLLLGLAGRDTDTSARVLLDMHTLDEGPEDVVDLLLDSGQVDADSAGRVLISMFGADDATTGSVTASAADIDPQVTGQVFVAAARGDSASTGDLVCLASETNTQAVGGALVRAAAGDAGVIQGAMGSAAQDDGACVSRLGSVIPVEAWLPESTPQEGADPTGAGQWQDVGSPPPIQNILARFPTNIPGAYTNIVSVLDQLSESGTLPEDSLTYDVLSIDPQEFTGDDTPAAHVTMFIDKQWLTANQVHEWSMQFSRYEGSTDTWVPTQTKRVSEDETNVYFTVTVPGFSTWAIHGSQSPAEVKFVEGGLRAEPAEVAIGEETTVSLDVTNQTDEPGVYFANLWVNGQIDRVAEYPIAAQETITVDLPFTATMDGAYEIRVGSEVLASPVLVGNAVLPNTGDTSVSGGLLLMLFLAGSLLLVAGSVVLRARAARDPA